MGARSAGNPHAACDVEGTGNVARSRGLSARQSSTLPEGGEAKAFPTPIDQASAPKDSTGKRRLGATISSWDASCGRRDSAKPAPS